MEKELLEEMKIISEKHVKALLKDLVVELAPKAMELAAQKSANKVDDALVAVLKEPIKQAMVELVEGIKF